MRRPEQHRRSNLNLLIPFGVLALVFGLLIWEKYTATRVVEPTPPAGQAEGQYAAVLFFVADGTRLAREGRELEPCSGTEACIKAVLNELLNGPVGELDSPLPESTVIDSVRLDGQVAVVDIGPGFAADLPSGSSAEMMAVYSIVNTICINFPYIAGVKLNVADATEGRLEHLDLSEPLAPDFSLEHTAEQSPASDSRKGTP